MTAGEGRAPIGDLPSRRLGPGFLVRLLGLGVVDAGLVFAIPVLVAGQAWVLLALLTAVGLAVNFAYLWPRARASRWLVPGLIFMGLFVVWPVVYTAYVALTNWATGNFLTKEQVIAQLEQVSVAAAGEGTELDLIVLRNPAGELRFYLTDGDGATYFGAPRPRTDPPRTERPIDPATLQILDDDGDGLPERVGEFEALKLRDLFGIADQLEQLVLDVPGGVAQVVTTSAARLVTASQRYTYDPASDTLLDNQENVACTVEVGTFVCPDGRRLDPGWRVLIGFDNFTRILGEQRLRGPFIGVFAWNLIFAGLSVVLTFAVGLFFANALQDDRVRGRAFYRSIFIIPYAIPGFIAALVWRGLLNDRFGPVNRMIETIGLPGPPWLESGFWAKAALLLVNTWLGFPYMFLIASGALQAIPSELKEAARVDGAGPARVFRTITLPLLLVSTSPLLIGSFAFNFNNFVLIFLLTGGGPPLPNVDVPRGATDLLITFTFKLAVQSGRGQNFGLGSAIVIIIFVVVATLSLISFRWTRRLEEVYGNV